jgi:hypothetical protein
MTLMNRSPISFFVRRHSWIVILGTQVLVQMAIVSVAHQSVAIDQRRGSHPLAKLSGFLLGRSSS